MTTPVTDPPLERAIELVATHQHGAASALQRWMRIGFREASDLMDQMHQLGYVGPASGSHARDVYVRHCDQCGRIGKRSFTVLEAPEIAPITVCTNKAACRKRWPKPPTDAAA
ncbi:MULTISPECIES: DNA translocase FtsK [unclassified Streptomyces]|uniref:DNA translocase FtsK n=1 Tax=unclassified Streptomyces TaxID=2593676 RepID=UPI0005610D4A|nr:MULTISPECIES: DNA translocase FtsK [unclassified Streptomyces]